MLWFNFIPGLIFYFPLSQTHYHTLPYPKKRKIKFKLGKKMKPQQIPSIDKWYPFHVI